MKKDTMRSSKIKNFFRILDTLSSVLSVLAVLLIYHRLTENHLNVFNNMKWKKAQEDMEANPSTTNNLKDTNIVGQLAVQVWPNICGGKLSNLFNSPFFPRFSEESYFISKSRAQLNKTNYGQRIVGYLHPKETGYFKFVLYSDDGSEFWFGTNESTTSLKLTASVGSRDRIGSAPVGEIRFESQISEDFLLEKGNKYPLEIIHLQGTEADFVELQWIRPGKHYLEMITSEYISHSTDFQSSSKITSLKAAMSQPSVAMATKFYLVAFLTDSIVKNTLPVCSYTLPVSIKPEVPRFHAYRDVKEVTIVTNEKEENWKANKEAKKVVELFMAGLEKIFPKKYTVVRLFNLERIPTGEASGSVLYLLELELGCDALDYTERVTEYVYLKNNDKEDTQSSDAQLCYPQDLGWNKEAVVHLILAVNHEGQRLHRFTEKLEKIFKESLEVDFRLIIVHFGKSGLDIEKILQGTLIQKHVVLELEEEFSRARAINSGVNLIQDPQHIVLTTDVHMDLPASIFHDCRKHCIEGKMVFAPVFYALNCGSYPDKPQGSWCSHGYQMIGIYKRDWDRIGGLEEGVQDEEATWDLVDRVLSRGLHVARAKSPNLFRLFYPESRDSQEPTGVYKRSGFFEENE